MHLIFYLHIRRSGMRLSPLLDIRQDLCTHFPQGLFIHLFSAPSLFQMDLSYHFPLAWTSRLQKGVGHPAAIVTGKWGECHAKSRYSYEDFRHDFLVHLFLERCGNPDGCT